MGCQAAYSVKSRKMKHDVLNVAFNANDGVTHYVSHNIRHFEGVVHKMHSSFTFTLRVNSYVTVTKGSASDKLVNLHITKTRRRNNKRMQPKDAMLNF